MFVDSTSRFLDKTFQADVSKRAGRLRDYLCRPQSPSKQLQRPAVEEEWNLGIHNKAASAGSSFVSSVVSVQMFLLDLSRRLAGGHMWAPDLQETSPVWPSPPLSHRGPEGPRGAYSFDCGLAAGELVSGTSHRSSIISPLRGLEKDLAGGPKVPGPTDLLRLSWPKSSAGSGPGGQLLLNSAAKIIQLQNIRRATLLTGTTFGPSWFCIFMSCSWTKLQILSGDNILRIILNCFTWLDLSLILLIFF